jgi:glutathione synthase
MDYHLLILTDHRVHTRENSVYALASALAAHPSINAVDIASRGLAENALFFDGQMDAVLSVIPALPRLTFARALQLFETSATEAELADYDFIILRLPPPIPGRLFHALPTVVPEDHIINEPSGIIRTSSKAFLSEVSDLCPPMHLIRKRADALDFLHQHSTVVLKPLYGYAGQGIIRLTNEFAEDATGQRMFHRPFFKQWSPPYLAMPFLKNVTQGDKRTIMVNDTIIGSALRKPEPGSWVCNVARGGNAVYADADRDEQRIARILSAELRKHGIVIFGFDTLVNDDGHRVLTEINTMSIGGLRQIRDREGKPLMKVIVSMLVQHLDTVWFGIS